MKIPSQHNRLMPYLIVADAHKFIKFMNTVFGATLQILVPRTEETVMHGEMYIDDAIIMFADATDEFPAQSAGMFIYVDSVDETYNKAMAAGSVSILKPTQQPYGYTCGFKDPFGNSWWPSEAPVMENQS